MELAKYLIDNDLYFSESPHEGLGLTYNACQKVYNFFRIIPISEKNAFNWEKCVEEFVFQSLSLNFDGKYFILGNGNGTKFHLPRLLGKYRTDRNTAKKQVFIQDL